MNSNFMRYSRNLTRFVSSWRKIQPRKTDVGNRHNYILQNNSNLIAPEIQVEFHYDGDQCGIVNVSENAYWRRKMRTVHNLLDVNKDGVISYDDFKLLADRFVFLGNLPEDHRIEFYAIIESIWREQWGCIGPYNLITIEQYLEDMKYVINDVDRRKRVHRLLPYLFMAVDKNHDGAISFSEYQLFFKCLGLSYQDSILSFESIDQDQNGVITLEEFVKLGIEYFLTVNENERSKLFWGPLLD